MLWWTYVDVDLIGISDGLSRGTIGVDEPLLARRESGGVVDGSGWRCSVSVLCGGDVRNGQPVHRFSLNTSHYRFALKLSHLFSQVPICPLGVFVRLEGHVPRVVMGKLARYKTGTVFSSEKSL